MNTTRRQRFIPFVLLSALGAFGSVGAGAAPPSASINLLADTDFKFGLKGRDREKRPVEIRWSPAAERPVWQVAQHHSQSNVADLAWQTIRPGGFTFKDERQWLSIHPEGEDADFILGVNARSEFNGKLRSKGDAWPHLYLTQRISPPDGHLGPDAASLADLAELEFGARVRLLYDRRNVVPGHDPRIHAAQFVFFLTIQNLNRASPGHGDYFWFGIMLYDDRYPVTSLKAQLDAGSPKKPATGKLIYDIGVKPFTERVVAAGEWVDVQGDLLPHVIAGLNEAWRRGYLGGSKNLSDYRVGSAVLGWEITGLNDAAMAVRDFRCRARRKP